jgi:peptidoglycan/xylan/chitin deacetylase (PgdA/CDA1 family)
MRRTGAVLTRALVQLLVAPNRARPLRTLVWHDIADDGGPLAVSRAAFTRQLDHLVALGYRTERAGDLAADIAAGKPHARRTVALTFDDGLAGAVRDGSIEIERRGLTATIFAVTGQVGTRPTWPERDGERIARDLRRRLGAAADGALKTVRAVLSRRLASWDELSAAAARGLDVLPHGREHRYLDEVDGAQLEDEIVGAIDDLRRAGFQGPRAMAWPYGVDDPRAIAVARRAGLVAAFAADHEWERRRDTDAFRLNRVPVSGAMTPADLRLALGPGYDLLALLRRLRRPATA